jgi:hypothetical protein
MPRSGAAASTPPRIVADDMSYPSEVARLFATFVFSEIIEDFARADLAPLRHRPAAVDRARDEAIKDITSIAKLLNHPPDAV